MSLAVSSNSGIALGILLSLRPDQHPNFLSSYSTVPHFILGFPGVTVGVVGVIDGVGGVTEGVDGVTRDVVGHVGCGRLAGT